MAANGVPVRWASVTHLPTSSRVLPHFKFVYDWELSFSGASISPAEAPAVVLSVSDIQGDYIVSVCNAELYHISANGYQTLNVLGSELSAELLLLDRIGNKLLFERRYTLPQRLDERMNDLYMYVNNSHTQFSLQRHQLMFC